MPYSLTMPHRLDVGQQFIVDLHISAPHAVVGEQYKLVPVPVIPCETLMIDTNTVEIKATEADGSATLMFRSMNGFQVAGLYKLAVNNSSFTNVGEIKCYVVLPAPLPIPGPVAGSGATGGGGGTLPVIVDPDAIATAVAAAIASRTPTPPTTPPARCFVSSCLSWIPPILIVLAVLVIYLGILGMPAWAVWLIAKNGNSQNGQPVTSASNGQVVNPICIYDCSAYGNLQVKP